MGSECKQNIFHNMKSQVTQLYTALKCLKYDSIVKFMYQPTDPSSLGIIRFLFGLLMVIDIFEERGGSEIDIRWGNPKTCHFPLFDFMKPLDFPYMSLLYGIMWLGALGIMVGFKFHLYCLLFGIPYWYILLLDKSYWNNHSYLYGLITILLMGSSANNFWSVDAYIDKEKNNSHVPYWNYFILKYQFFMLYFLAGLKKTDTEWLEGYSMTNLGYHWVFAPFTLVLTVQQIDYLIVHWFGFLLDLTIGFWMLIKYTRPVAMLFCASFHLMNSRLFSIGMFPYVCLATMPLFCEETWPRKIQKFFTNQAVELKPNQYCIYEEKEIERYKDHKNLTNEIRSQVGWKHRFVTALLLTHCGLQAFLPYSHFITKGYNNWTKGLYGYSWDMMVHSWDTILVVVKVVDNDSGQEYFLDPEAWTLKDRWNKHADMCLQYAHCLKRNLISSSEENVLKRNSVQNLEGNMPVHTISQNLSVYIDVWCSLNGRFQQRMYDPNYDLLKANWSPFKPVEWLFPLLSSYSGLRTKMTEISREVFSWSNYSDVLFVADFPGMHLENYVNEDLDNVTLSVLEGEVIYEIEDDYTGQSIGKKLKKGMSFPIEVGTFHKIHTVSETPSCYMYTFINRTNEYMQETRHNTMFEKRRMYSPFPLLEDVPERVENLSNMMKHIKNSILYLVFNQPLDTKGK